MHGIDFSTPDFSVPCLLLLQESLPSPTLPFPSEVILLEVRTDFYLWQHLLIFLGCYFLSFQVSLSLPLPQWSSGTTVTSDLLGWLPFTLLNQPSILSGLFTWPEFLYSINYYTQALLSPSTPYPTLSLLYSLEQTHNFGFIQPLLSYTCTHIAE